MKMRIKLFDPELRFFEHKLPRRAVGLLAALVYSYAGAMSIARALSPDMCGDIARWCAMLAIVFAVCFYNRITTVLSLAGGAVLLVMKRAIVWEWLSGDFFGALITTVLYALDGEAPTPEQYATLTAVIIVLGALSAYLSAGRLSGAGTMLFGTAFIYFILWYSGASGFFGELALRGAVIVFIIALGYGRIRARAEERDLDYDYEESKRPLLGSRSGLNREPRVVSGGGASALAVGAVVYAACAALLVSMCTIPSTSFRSNVIGGAVDSVISIADEWLGSKGDAAKDSLVEAGFINKNDVEDKEDDSEESETKSAPGYDGSEVRGKVSSVVLTVVLICIIPMAAYEVVYSPIVLPKLKKGRGTVVLWQRDIRLCEQILARLYTLRGGDAAFFDKYLARVMPRRAELQASVIAAVRRKKAPSPAQLRFIWLQSLRMRLYTALRITPPVYIIWRWSPTLYKLAARFIGGKLKAGSGKPVLGNRVKK